MGKKKEIKKIERLYLGAKNFYFLGAGIISIILGYITLAKGSITISPILLVLGYLVLIPIGIMIK